MERREEEKMLGRRDEGGECEGRAGEERRDEKRSRGTGRGV